MNKMNRIRLVSLALMLLMLLQALAACVDSGSEKGTTPPTETDTENVTENNTEPGTEDASEPGTEGNTEQGTEENTEPGDVTYPPDENKAGIIYTDYAAYDFATETEREYGKLTGKGSSITITGVDGGTKGGLTDAVLDFCTEPNKDTTLSIEVNGVKAYEFTVGGGSGWFEMQKKSFEITLNPGKNNTIKITNNTTWIAHVNLVTVGDVDENNGIMVEIDKNATSYAFKDAKPSATDKYNGNTHAKLSKGQKITVTNVDGGDNGGVCDAYINGAITTGAATTLKLQVNDNKAYLLQIEGITDGKYDAFATLFSTYLKPGATNTVTIEVVEGSITLLNSLGIGKTDGSKNNPYASEKGELIGSDKATVDGAVSFLEGKNIIKSGNSVKNDSVEALTHITGSSTEASSIYNALCSDDKPTQKEFLAMLLRGMGYSDADASSAMRTAQVLGIVKNIPSSSYGDVDLDRETLAAYVYNALSSECKDGNTLGKKLNIDTNKEEYKMNLSAQDLKSSVSGNNVTVVSANGGLSTVSTVDSYKRFSLTADVKADKLNGFVMGFRLKNATDTINNSGIWVRIVDQNVQLISGGKTVYCEVPMGLFNVTEGVTMQVVDNGESINIYSVIGDAIAPFFEIRFVDGYAVAYVRGHLIHGLSAANIADSGHIAFASYLENVQYNNISITEVDAVQNLNSDFPEVGEGEYFEATESFDNGMYDYNLFVGTGGTMSVKDGQLVFKGGRENIFSTIMRVKDGVLEADVLPGSGDVQFQIGASSNMSAGYYYCGLRFTVRSGAVDLYHDTGNMDEEAKMIESFSRGHKVNVNQGYSVRVSLIDGVLSFSIKGANDAEYTEIIRGVTAVSKIDGREYFSILDSKGEKEQYHFDKLMREFGYLRIVSDKDAKIENVRVSGKAYLPYEQMEILPAPEPDEGKKLEADDVESLVGIGYLPYFTRYRGGVRPSVEDLLPAVIEAAKLKGEEREAALNKLYWGYAWWAEPAQGMYCGRDYQAAKTNLEMIANAGVDFIFIDQTNFNGGCTPDDIMNNIENILEAALELEAEGKKYPKISFWNNVRNEPGWERGGYEDTAREIWQVFISNERYRNLWVYYHGKILMMYTFGQPMPYLGMTEVAEIREMWTMGNAKNTWSFHHDPQYMDGRGGLDAEGNLEQLYVLPYGRTTFNGNVSMLPSTVENGLGGREGGLYYQKYWEKVFEERPKFVMIWAYNHWDVNFKRPESNGQAYWGDNFSIEYSGGIEPIKNYFEYKGVKYVGDSYYQWTKEYIRAYKAGEDRPMDLTYQNPEYQVKD